MGKPSISEYDFTVNQDFTTVSKNLENGGRSIDYYITLDMAKELSMVERNEKGKQDFSTWIKNRIEKYDFVENEDYISFPKIGERGVGGTNLWRIKTLLSSPKLGSFQRQGRWLLNTTTTAF